VRVFGSVLTLICQGLGGIIAPYDKCFAGILGRSARLVSCIVFVSFLVAPSHMTFEGHGNADHAN
jgi:hypothetical protein